MILPRLAWRNVLRNKRRTVLAGLAIGIGLASLIFTDALIVGMQESMIRSATDTFLGHAQIHSSEFRESLDVNATINDLEAVISGLNKEEIISHYTLRTQAYGMVTSPSNVSSTLFYGIDPTGEREISKIDEAMIRGSYIDRKESRRILIGSRLAETIEVDLGDRIVITAAQAHSGQLAQEMFRVGGIFHFNVKEMDSGMVIMDLEEARNLLGLQGEAHEIALFFRDITHAGDRTLPFWNRYSAGGNEALGWRDLMKELDAVLGMSGYTKYIMAFILFGIVALIILNTLFMSLYERLFEFGILRAVGTRPLNMAAVIFLEAAFLSAISAVIGIIIGALVTYYFSLHGIDYRGMEFADVTFRELIYPVINVHQYITYPVWVFFFALVAAFYPAVYTARLTPARVMRRSL